MNAQTALTIGQEALVLLLTVSLPVLLAVLAVGLLVSIFQAITQIHEATLAFVPKLIAAVAVLACAISIPIGPPPITNKRSGRSSIWKILLLS